MSTLLARGGSLLALLALAATGCAGPQIPQGLSGEGLRSSGKGVLVVAAKFVTTTVSTNCELLELTRAGDGRKVNVMLATHLPFEDPEVSGGVTLDPGTYAVTLAVCSRNDTRYVIEPPDARGIAKVSIGHGEVVDGGMLVLFDVFKPLFTPYIGKSNIFVIVRPRPGPAPKSLNRELAARMTSRPMTAVDPPPPDVLAGMCEHHRQHAKTLWFSSGGGHSPLCQLVGQGPAGPRKPN
jgi:hypothetical protein